MCLETPSLRLIVGRVVWKSKNSSGSTCAISSASSDSAAVASAREDALAASFQPRKEQTRTGDRNCGTSLSQVRESTHRAYRGERARRVSRYAKNSATPAKESCSARSETLLATTTPTSTPSGESAPIHSAARKSTLP